MPPPIFKLPTELFLNIADYVDQQDHLQYYQLGRDMSILPIINFSMTCRRFRDVSAHLLVKTLTVDITKSSLERFESIAQHPSIGSGVLDVVISLRFFSRELCEDLTKFMNFYTEKLEAYIDSPAGGRTKVSIPYYAGRHGEGERVLDAWSRISKSKPHRHWGREVKVHRALFKEAHAFYKKSYTEQQSLMKTGEFNRRIAAAMARMPRAKDLRVADDALFHVRQEHWDMPVRPGVALSDAYFQPMRVGVTGQQAWDRRGTIVLAQSNLYPTIIHLPIALQRAGVSIRDFAVTLGGLQDDDILKCDLTTLRAFSSAIQSLRSLHFSDTPIINVRSRRSLNHLPIYLAHLLNNPSLREINLDISNIEGALYSSHDPSNAVLPRLPGSCLTHTPGLQRKFLEKVTFWNANFRCAELLVFISSLPTRIEEFLLMEVRLLDGTWEEVIDRLRKKKFSTEDSVKLSGLLGGERDGGDDDDLVSIFYEGEMGWSPLEQYCVRFKQRNPLRLYREGEWDADEYLNEGPGEPEPYE